MAMRPTLSRLYSASLRDIVGLIRRKLVVPDKRFLNGQTIQSISEILRQRFEIYNTANLAGIGKEQFREYLQSKIGVTDAQSEGYSESELEWQRDLSVKFHWGHNHDFGEFSVEGRMGDRHINLLANFTTLFPISLQDFEGREVFDIGCWTGGTTLLLSALGSKVFAIEEVRKYAEMVAFLSQSFGIEDRVTVEARSIYSCNSAEFSCRFDIVHFPGVIYHLSDPIVALRILYNALKIGGIILIESAGINTVEPYCRFWGNKTVQKTPDSGWAWFWPSPSALSRMMREAGFDQVNTLWHLPSGRIYGYGKKVSHVGICKAGLSVPKLS
jgi:SAM-dependent methyltransferase